MSRDRQVDFSVVILGGGLVGSLLALQLGRHGVGTLLLDSGDFAPRWPRDHYDIRVSAITRATENMFRNLGVWPAMLGRRVQAYQDMRVWDSGGDGSIHFDSALIGQASLGHIVENSVMLDSLHDALRALPAVEMQAAVSAAEIKVETDRSLLTLADGRVVRSRLLVGADGARSWLRQRLGIETVSWPYEQSAVVATVAVAAGHQNTAWQRFLPTGPLAFLPLTAPYCSIVWSTAPAQAQRLAALPMAQFNDELTEAFAARLGAVSLHGERGVFPLRLLHARDYVRPRIALIGDAAHNIHPLAGQGVNLGFADAASLGELVVQAHERGVDVGGLLLLRRYERWRKGQNLATMALMDAFKRVYGNQGALLRQARNSAMTLTDRLPPLKALLNRYAMGLAGDLPALARAHPLPGE